MLLTSNAFADRVPMRSAGCLLDRLSRKRILHRLSPTKSPLRDHRPPSFVIIHDNFPGPNATYRGSVEGWPVIKRSFHRHRSRV